MRRVEVEFRFQKFILHLMETYRPIASTCCLSCGGATGYCHKVAAVLHAIKLETGHRQETIDSYCNQVVACLSDQGSLALGELDTWKLSYKMEG